MVLLIKSEQNLELMVEILGIVANLTIPDFDYEKLVKTYNLVDFLSRRFNFSIQKSKYSNDEHSAGGIEEDDDVLLQSIILFGTIANDEAVVPLVAKSMLLPMLVQIMMSKPFIILTVLQWKKKMTRSYCKHATVFTNIYYTVELVEF